MRLVFKIFVLLSCLNSFSQEDFKDTTWLDLDFKKTTKDNANFYRVYKKYNEKYVVIDRFASGQMQMYSEATQIEPIIKDGITIWYNKNGFKNAKGYYKKNNKIGTHTKYFENEKDSSVYTINDNGTPNYIRRSELQKKEILPKNEVVARYPGGTNEMYNFIIKNIKYPKNISTKKIGGSVIVKVIIDVNGKIVEPKIEKSTGIKDLDEEALRIVNLMPVFEPATMGDNKVISSFYIPMSFVLAEPFYFLNSKNKNKNYLELFDAIVENDLYKIWNKIKDVGENETDFDYLFLKGVLFYHNSKHKEGCKIFEKVFSSAEVNSNAYTLSNRFILIYCK